MGDTETNASLTEKDFSLLTQAYNEFNEKRYENCLKSLTELEDSMGSSTKIQHNKAIVEFYKTNCKTYKNLLEFLLPNISQYEQNSIDTQNHSISTAAYNVAVIYFHLKKPFAALKVLTPIAKTLEDLDESIASKIGLLMISLLLQTNQISKAGAFLKNLESHLRINLDSLSSEENTSIDSLAHVNSFKRMFRLMALLTNIVNKFNVIVPDDSSVEYAVLKAHQYYVGKDFQMAAKQLSKKFTSNQFKADIQGEDQDTIIANNMGVIHLRVRHYAIAAKFFQQAITFDIKTSKSLKNASLQYLNGPMMPEILYNLGISMLHLQRPKDAFECFLVPLKIYHNNPRLWLRVAESCIMFYERNILEIEKKRIISSVVGSGIHRKYILEPSPKIKFPEDGHSSAIPNPNLEFAALCLRNAVTLIQNYKNKFNGNNSVNVNLTSWTEYEDENFCSPSMPVTKESYDNLIAAIYASYSYVSIRLGDFVVALEYAKMLLELQNLSDAYTMLGHLYCAESLVMLDRLSEARSHLEPKIITNSNYFDFETRNWQLNSLEAAQAVIKYNLVVTLVLQGEFDVARALLSTFTHTVIMTKVKILKMYIELATGKF